MDAEFGTELPSNTLGKYQFIAALGRGGMAEVFLAAVRGPAADKLLVVKMLRQDAYPTRTQLTSMFMDEARIAARLNHPNIVQTYEVGEIDGRYFIAMEYLEGQTLRELQRKLRAGGLTLPLGEAVRIVIETAHALHYVHELKAFDGSSLEIVHRDVSPHNVLLTYEGNVKLLDFGIAKGRHSESSTEFGVIKGKLDYIAPEQLRGEAPDRRADIFALGVMAWEAVTGLRFAGGRQVLEAAKCRRRMTGDEPKLRLVKPDIPEPLERVIERALALDPKCRYATAAEFAEALESFLEQANLHPKPRALGEHVAAAFQAERAELSAQIRRQLEQLPRSPSDHPLALVRPGVEHGGSRGLSALRSRLTVTTEAPAAPQLRPVDLEPTTLSASGHELRTRRLSRVQLGVCCGTVVTAMALAWFAPRPGAGPRPVPIAGAREAPTAAPPAAATARAVVQTPTPETLQLRIEVTPAHAEVTLDGAALPTLPFSAALRKDGATHYVEASAAGYASKRIVLPFDHDRELKLVLQRAATRPKRAEPARPPLAAAPAVGSAAAPTPTRELEPGEAMELRARVHASIDTSNPYGD